MQGLSPRMRNAIRDMYQHGDYELMELQQWNWWQSIRKGEGSPNIRTDTMKGLINRGLVQESYDKKRVLCKWTATLTDAGKNIATILFTKTK